MKIRVKSPHSGLFLDVSKMSIISKQKHISTKSLSNQKIGVFLSIENGHSLISIKKWRYTVLLKLPILKSKWRNQWEVTLDPLKNLQKIKICIKWHFLACAGSWSSTWTKNINKYVVSLIKFQLWKIVLWFCSGRHSHEICHNSYLKIDIS